MIKWYRCVQREDQCNSNSNVILWSKECSCNATINAGRPPRQFTIMNIPDSSSGEFNSVPYPVKLSIILIEGICGR